MNEPLALELVRVAQGELGVRESGINQGEDVYKYMTATWMPEASNRKGYAWCAAFVCWCMTQAVNNLELDPGDYVYPGADAFGWEKWARKKGWYLFEWDAMALPGDLITFDMSHIGIVVEDKRDYIVTVEGNTGPEGGRDGDGVYERHRVHSPGLINYIIRFK